MAIYFVVILSAFLQIVSQIYSSNRASLTALFVTSKASPLLNSGDRKLTPSRYYTIKISYYKDFVCTS